MYKQSAENLYRRDKRVTNAFEEESSEEASEILISDVKAAYLFNLYAEHTKKKKKLS